MALSSRTNKHAHTEREREKQTETHAAREEKQVVWTEEEGEASFVCNVFSRERVVSKKKS